jgi:trimethylamine--corrinoid protein Co-methyltransferase
MLARRGLPCTIIPMPLTGGTSPCSVVANVVVGNAEVLGVLAAIHAAVPGALAGGGVISGIMDMASASASFSAPEAILQDACFAQMYDVFYGQDFAIGTGYADAKYPGPQALAEKALKFQAAAWQGRFNFPVGLLAGGKRFSPEQAVMDLEIAETVRRMHAGVEVDSGSLAVEVIQRVGIGGEFLSDEHTVANFRRNLWIPPLSDRRCAGTLEADRRKDMLEAARQKVRDIWRRDDLYRIDDDRARAIDKVVAAAERILL